MKAKLIPLAATVLAGLFLSWFAAIPLSVAQSCPATQSSPGFNSGGSVFGKIAAQWNAYFAAKVDSNNGTLCNPTILGTLNLTASVVVNALGYTPMAADTTNAPSPTYFNVPVAFGLSRLLAPNGQVEVRGTSNAPLVVSRAIGLLGATVGPSYQMLDSSLNRVEYGSLGAGIISNSPGNFDGVALLYAAHNGARTEYLRAGNGGVCVAEGGTFCGLSLNSPPQDGLILKGGLSVGATVSKATMTPAVIYQDGALSTSTLSKTNNTLTAVPGLAVSLVAGASYQCRGHLTVTSSGAPGGLKVTLANGDTLTVTSLSMTGVNYNGTTTNARSTATALGTAIGGINAVATDFNFDAGIVVNAGGTLQVQAAQNTSDATATVIGVNSTLDCKRTA